MARTYKRDSRGRFAGGGGSSRGGGRKPMQRGTNRLTRDNAGRITSVGGDGATARGGRLRTASGKKRATVTAKGIGKAPAGTVGRSGKVKGAARVAKPAAPAKPASKLGFTQSDFARRSQRTASIRNPQVKAKAQQLYGKILDLNSTPRQLKSMFKKAGKPKQRTATAATRQMRREHQNMMAASKVLFK